MNPSSWVSKAPPKGRTVEVNWGKLRRSAEDVHMHSTIQEFVGGKADEPENPQDFSDIPIHPLWKRVGTSASPALGLAT